MEDSLERLARIKIARVFLSRMYGQFRKNNISKRDECITRTCIIIKAVSWRNPLEFIVGISGKLNTCSENRTLPPFLR